MDVAVNLVESYLRLNGYLTLSEFEVQAKTENGTYETITDVDIGAVRFPGEPTAGPEDCRVLLIDDELLRIDPDTIDVIIGEVKQGEAVFNPRLTRREVLHAFLKRLEWLYVDGVGGVVTDLQERGVSEAAARGGGVIRTRLVAFGRSEHANLHIVPLGRLLQSMLAFMRDFDDVLRPAQFRDPVPALLRLMVKTGIDVHDTAQPAARLPDSR